MFRILRVNGDVIENVVIVAQARQALTNVSRPRTGRLLVPR